MPGRPLIWTVLLSVCCAMFPLPIAVIPSGDAEAESGKAGPAFPCQTRPCGCKSAHQCWTQCCCFSPAQRTAWAKQHQVTPPVYAILEDSKTTKVVENAQPKPSCCATKKACCSPKQTVSKSDSTRWVLSVMALKCRGLSTDVTSLPWTILDDLLAPLAVEPLEVVPIPRMPTPPSYVSLLDSPPPRA